MTLHWMCVQKMVFLFIFQAYFLPHTLNCVCVSLSITTCPPPTSRQPLTPLLLIYFTLSFIILNIKRMDTFQFCFLGLLPIHRNRNWKEFLKSCESFLENLSFLQLMTLPKLKNWQNGTFEPMHEIQKLFRLKDFFRSIIKVTLKKISNMS